jgi:hypothetical protein
MQLHLMVFLAKLTVGAACCCRFAILTSRAFTKLPEATLCQPGPLLAVKGALCALGLALANTAVLAMGA